MGHGIGAGRADGCAGVRGQRYAVCVLGGGNVHGHVGGDVADLIGVGVAGRGLDGDRHAVLRDGGRGLRVAVGKRDGKGQGVAVLDGLAGILTCKAGVAVDGQRVGVGRGGHGDSHVAGDVRQGHGDRIAGNCLRNRCADGGHGGDVLVVARVEADRKRVGPVMVHVQRRAVGGCARAELVGGGIGLRSPLCGQGHASVAAGKRGVCGKRRGFGPVASVVRNRPADEVIAGLAPGGQLAGAFDVVIRCGGHAVNHIRNGVGSGLVLGFERGAAVLAVDACAGGVSRVRGPASVRRSDLPVNEGIAGLFGCRQGRGIARLVSKRRDRIAAVHVKGDGVADLIPLCVQDRIRGRRILAVRQRCRSGAGFVRIPAHEGVAVACGRGRRNGARRPVRVQREGAVLGGRQIAYVLLVVIDLCAGGGRSPAVEGRGRGRRGVAAAVLVVEGDGVGAGIFVFGQVLRGAVNKILLRHGAGGGAVAVKGDLVGIAGPLRGHGNVSGGRVGGVCVAVFGAAACRGIPAGKVVARAGRRGQGHGLGGPVCVQVLCAGGRKVRNALLVVIGFCSCRGERPAVKGIGRRVAGLCGRAAVAVVGHGVGAAESVLRQVLRNVVGEALIAHGAGGGAVAVEMDFVAVGGPLCMERGVGGDVPGSGGGACRRVILGAGAVFAGVVPAEGIAGFGGHGGGGHRAIIGGGDLRRAAAGRALVIERDRVVVRLPYGVQLQVRIGRIGRAAVVGAVCGGRRGAGAPAEEGIARTGGRGGAQRKVFAVKLLLCCGRAGAAVGVVGDVVDLFKPERETAGAGGVELYAVVVGLPGGELLLQDKLRACLSEVDAVVGFDAAVIVVVGGDLRSAVGVVAVIKKHHVVGGRLTVDQVIPCYGRRELIQFHFIAVRDGRRVVVVGSQRRRVGLEPQRVKVAGVRDRVHVRNCLIRLAGVVGPADQRVVFTGKARHRVEIRVGVSHGQVHDFHIVSVRCGMEFDGPVQADLYGIAAGRAAVQELRIHIVGRTGGQVGRGVMLPVVDAQSGVPAVGGTDVVVVGKLRTGGIVDVSAVVPVGFGGLRPERVAGGGGGGKLIAVALAPHGDIDVGRRVQADRRQGAQQIVFRGVDVCLRIGTGIPVVQVGKDRLRGVQGAVE